MGIEKVMEEVIAKAKKRSAQIIAEARKEADESISSAMKTAEEAKRSALQDAERELSEQKTREIASAELDVIKSLLNARKKIIDDVFQEAIDRISRIPPSRRKEHIDNIISMAKKELEIHRLLCNEKDIRHISGYRAQPCNIMGGIIAENKDGSIRIDYSYEAMLEKTKEVTLKDVAKTLFKNE
ncbi:hypothetical protein HYY72_03725 [Candidatus Woesearchaeota archaeon]|nr:hypothetical protein [Candidatus Woesearchaeota archaeon]